ncbi:MAG: phosphatidylglycerol lysyltransferase domain-containing protein [Anaerolineales bacterium]
MKFKVAQFKRSQKTKWEGWLVRAIALLTASMGVLNLLSASRPAILWRLQLVENLFPLIVRRGSHFTSVLAGFALILLSFQLARRKRVAWLITLIVLALTTLTHLLKNLNYEEALLSAGLFILLLLAKDLFYALSDPPSVVQGIRTLVLAFVFVILYSTSGFYFLSRHFQTKFDFFTALIQAFYIAFFISPPAVQASTSYGRYFMDSVYGLSLISYSYSFYMLARPVLIRQGANETERKRAAQIIQKYGRTSLAHICLLGDKSYFFSSGGSVISFVAKGRGAIALGDPIGPAEDIFNAIQEFQSFCNKNDWISAYYQTTADYLDEYKRCGYESLCIGSEAIVDLSSFTLEGSENKNLRNAINKLRKLNIQTTVLEPPIPSEYLEELRSISNEWLAFMHGTEKRFSVGWFDEAYIRSERVMICTAPTGEIIAFANILPAYQKKEVSIDLMRRRKNAINGTMEFLFVSLFEWAKEHQYETFSLGLSALAGIGEAKDSPIPEKILHLIYDHIHQFYNFKGLHEFKAKFHPRWEARYLIYPGVSTVVDVLSALIRADSGDDFWRGYIRIKR